MKYQICEVYLTYINIKNPPYFDTMGRREYNHAVGTIKTIATGKENHVSVVEQNSLHGYVLVVT